MQQNVLDDEALSAALAAQARNQFMDAIAGDVAAFAAAQGSSGLAAMSGEPFRQLKVEDALSYLDQVKLEFGDRPDVYNRFLDIMKDFKAQSYGIDTPGVIARVSELFHGHRDLIMGFNTFLPPGYKIGMIEGTPPGSPTGQEPDSPSGRPRQPVEFDQAINYVTRIKTRFSDQPDVYRQFLDILHTYQKEQRGIKEVYDEVAELFQEHTDLLDEFSNFLPERAPQAPPPTRQPSRPQNKNRQQQRPKPIAAKPGKKGADFRRGNAKRTAARRADEMFKRQTGGDDLGGASSGASEEEDTRERDRERDRAIEREHDRVRDRAELRERDRDREREFNREREPRRPILPAVPIPADARAEMMFFEKVKRRLAAPVVYKEFLKCLNLFSQGVLVRQELLTLVRDLLGKHPDLFKEFKRFLQTGSDAQQNGQTHVPFSELEFTTTSAYGPSYRQLPSSYPVRTCTGRMYVQDDRVLFNDRLVSVPMGSEDFAFKSSRKNASEEQLFRTEDDRFELDVVIEQNHAAMLAIYTMLERLKDLKSVEQERFDWSPIFAPLYIKAINRLYGEKAPDIMACVRREPQFVLPFILRRMQQKDGEWRRAKREWNRTWSEVYERNYSKSLDHQSMMFKANEKRNLSSKALVGEIKQAGHLELSFGDPAVHRDVLAILEHQATALDDDTSEQVKNFLKGVLTPFLNLAGLEASAPDRSALPLDGSSDLQAMELDAITPAAPLPAVTAPDSSDAAAPMDEDFPPLTIISNSNRPSCPSTLIFGNSTLFMVFRLYQIMYERLAKGREQGMQQAAKDAEMVQQAAASATPRPTESDPMLSANQPTPAPPMQVPKVSTKTGEERYQHFLTMVRTLQDAELDVTKFEDDTRELFGFNSYPLFTLSNLLFQVMRQMTSLVADEACEGLLNLLAYEQSRRSQFNETTYRQNAVQLLGDELYRFENDAATGKLLIRYSNDMPGHAKQFKNLEESWTQYVVDYTHSNTTTLDAQKQHVFLTHQLVKSQKHAASADDLEVANALECKIDLKTCKLYYAKNTEDFMYRKGKLHKPRDAEDRNKNRRERTSRWHDQWWAQEQRKLV
eukprot:TRINITY_DN1047_c0_g1_i1.p1 TRINITY_DN1047_c0_g1~~TRINITY_DN1047_c0_g1_i1.p1  ORF type:complete len:1080 (-),score=264.31 TRINITY_DN1047_c0_g1_i1:62-3301(-)